LVSSGIIRGERRFAPGSASIVSRRVAKVTTIGWAGPNRPKYGRGRHVVQISQRGKEYLKTAQTLLRAAKTLTGQAIAAHLKTFSDDYERRSGKVSLDDAKQCSIRC
jgi:hypothetical protein